MQNKFKPKYIDIHSHLNLAPLKEREEEVVRKMVEEEVATITIGVDLETSKEAIKIAERYDFIWAGIGMHPNDNQEEVFDFDTYLELAKNEKVVCIGECGLDYFRGEKEKIREKQIEIFKKQVQIASMVKKPLMIHARPSKGTMDAYEDVIQIIKEHNSSSLDSKLSGNFHFYVGDLKITDQILDLDFSMSFDGPITFSSDYDEVIKHIPLSKIHAETDAPFASPVPFRGKVCEPFMVKEVVKKIASLKGEDEENLKIKLLQNAKDFFGIDFLC